MQLFAVHQNLKFCFRKPFSHVWPVKSEISSQAHHRGENSCCNHTKHHTGHAFFISSPLSCHESYLVFFPPMEMHINKQPSHWNLDQIGQKDIFFLSYCYVFYIRVRIWVLARGNRGSSYRTLETKLESNLLQYYLIPFWSGAMDRNSRIFVSVIREHGILLNL